MGTMIDDVKQKLLDKLAEEPLMVISTAYAYAKNYVMYGEDITKEWTTAVQQASILDYVRQKARAEAYDSFKKEYENQLKAEKVAMLTELQLEIEELDTYDIERTHGLIEDGYVAKDVNKVIQQKINALKETKMFEVEEMEGCHSCRYGENFDTEKEPCKYCYGLSLYTKKENELKADQEGEE